MVDVKYPDFEPRFYALLVCWYKKLTMCSYLIAVTCMNEYKSFNSSRNDANQRSRRLEMPWLNIQRRWIFFHSLIQTISLLRKTTQYVLTKHLKPICISQIRKKIPRLFAFLDPSGTLRSCSAAVSVKPVMFWLFGNPNRQRKTKRKGRLPTYLQDIVEFQASSMDYKFLTVRSTNL